jgi:hypothetical protein
MEAGFRETHSHQEELEQGMQAIRQPSPLSSLLQAHAFSPRSKLIKPYPLNPCCPPAAGAEVGERTPEYQRSVICTPVHPNSPEAPP